MRKILSIIIVTTLIMTMFTSCEAIDEVLASTYLNLGEKYLTDLDYENAIVYFNKLIEVEPKNVQAYLGAAEAYVALGDIDSAIAILKQGTEAVEDSTELQVMLESCYSELVFLTTIAYFYEYAEWADGWIEIEYDSNWNEIKYTEHEFYGSFDEYEYDLNGNEIRNTEYSSDGNVETWTEWEYDLSGNITKCTVYNADGNVNFWVEYDYASNGNEISSVYHGSDGGVHYLTVSENDLTEDRVKVTHYNLSGKIRSEYEFDLNWNLVYLVYYDSDESISSRTEYEYDSNWNITRSTNYDSTGDASSIREYEYDSDGILINDLLYNTDGSVIWKREYDSNGNVMKAIYEDYWIEYERDSNGNAIKSTTYASDGSLEWSEEYDFIGNTIMVYETFYSYEYDYEYDSSGVVTSRKIMAYDLDGILGCIVYQSRIN